MVILTGYSQVIEDSANRLYAVRDTEDKDLAHCFYGVEVKRIGGAYVPKAKAREYLVRRAATRHVIDL